MTIIRYGETLEIAHPRRYSFYDGQQFGNWTVIDKECFRRSGRIFVRVRCECGIEKFVMAEHLLNHRSSGCRRCVNMTQNIGNNHHLWSSIVKISNALYYRCKKSAEIRNIQFDITLSDMAELWESQKDRCALTGKVISFGVN